MEFNLKQALLALALPPSVPGPGNKKNKRLYFRQPKPNWIGGPSKADKEFLRSGDPSNRDVLVTTEESPKTDMALELTRSILMLFLCVTHKKKAGCSSSIWELPTVISEMIIRQNFPLFYYHRQLYDLNIITITELKHHEREKAQAISVIFDRESCARIEVFMVVGERDDVKYSRYYRDLFQEVTPGHLGKGWRCAHEYGWLVAGDGSKENRYDEWLQIVEGGVCYYDPIKYEDQQVLCMQVIKWLVMNNAPGIKNCTLVICMNHERLSNAKQDNILNAVSTLLLLWRGIGPQKSKVLIMKGNVHNPQSTQEALETLVSATLSGPDFRLENDGRLRLQYGLLPQKPIDPALRELVANSNSFGHEGPVSEPFREWCQRIQRAVTWGPCHSRKVLKTGQREGPNYCVSMTVVPGGRAVQVEYRDQGLGMQANVNQREITVRSRKKTKEEKEQERQRQKLEPQSNGKEPMNA